MQVRSTSLGHQGGALGLGLGSPWPPHPAGEKAELILLEKEGALVCDPTNRELPGWASSRTEARLTSLLSSNVCLPFLLLVPSAHKQVSRALNQT